MEVISKERLLAVFDKNLPPSMTSWLNQYVEMQPSFDLEELKRDLHGLIVSPCNGKASQCRLQESCLQCQKNSVNNIVDRFFGEG